MLKSIIFWVIRFFDCLFSAYYWQKKIWPRLKNLFSWKTLLTIIITALFVGVSLITYPFAFIIASLRSIFLFVFPKSPFKGLGMPLEFASELLNSGSSLEDAFAWAEEQIAQREKLLLSS